MPTVFSSWRICRVVVALSIHLAFLLLEFDILIVFCFSLFSVVLLFLSFMKDFFQFPLPLFKIDKELLSGDEKPFEIIYFYCLRNGPLSGLHRTDLCVRYAPHTMVLERFKVHMHKVSLSGRGDLGSVFLFCMNKIITRRHIDE